MVVARMQLPAKIRGDIDTGHLTVSDSTLAHDRTSRPDPNAAWRALHWGVDRSCTLDCAAVRRGGNLGDNDCRRDLAVADSNAAAHVEQARSRGRFDDLAAGVGVCHSIDAGCWGDRRACRWHR